MAPCVAEIVFRACAKRGGEFFAVDVDFFVTFAPPCAERIPDMEHHAAPTAATTGVQNAPVDGLPFRLGERFGIVAMPFGVETTIIFKRLRQRGGLEGGCAFDGFIAAIEQRDTGGLERHEPTAPESPIFFDTSRIGGEWIDAGLRSEEGVQRRPDGRFVAAVPIYLHDKIHQKGASGLHVFRKLQLQ